MILVKCECGCFYTIKTNNLLTFPDETHPTEHVCQNCGQRHVFDLDILFAKTSSKSTEQNCPYEIELVPDNAKITVTFTP